MASIVAFPIIFLAIGAVTFLSSKRSKLRSRIKELIRIRVDYNRLTILFAIIGLAVFILIARNQNPLDQMRYGDILAIFIFVLTAIAISRWNERTNQRIASTVGLASVMILIAASAGYVYAQTPYNSQNIYTMYSGFYNPSTASIFYNPDFGGSIFSQAKAIMANSTYRGCRVVSNDWPYLRFMGMDAQDPYSLNESASRYPIVYFRQIGVDANLTGGLGGYSTLYNSTALEIIVPSSVVCNETD
jgi:hypothetical protein